MRTGPLRVVCCLLVFSFAPPALARASGDSDDDEPVVAAKVVKPNRGKAVAFDARWLQPFFAGAVAAKGAADFRQERWAAAETELTKAAARMPAGSDERNAARYLVALARANQSKWAEVDWTDAAAN